MFALKRWRLALIALMAAIAVSVSSGSAFASEPGESSNWQPEDSNTVNLQSPDTVSEARDAHGTLVDVWRGFDNRVWLDVNNGGAFSIGTTATTVAPRVAYFPGQDRFFIFHTGTNGSIYYSYAQAVAARSPGSWSGWTQLTGNYTNQSVSIAASSEGMMVAYRGSGNDTRLFYAWLDRGTGSWYPATEMTGGRSNSAPTVTFNPVTNQYAAVIRGYDDDRIYIAYQDFGSSTWSTWSQLPSITTNSSPAIAANSNGSYLISVRDYNGNVWFQAVTRTGGYEGWQQENQHYRTSVSPFLSVAGAFIYILLTGLDDGHVYWKAAFNG
jgi:hypothetical protein